MASNKLWYMTETTLKNLYDAAKGLLGIIVNHSAIQDKTTPSALTELLASAGAELTDQVASLLTIGDSTAEVILPRCITSLSGTEFKNKRMRTFSADTIQIIPDYGFAIDDMSGDTLTQVSLDGCQHIGSYAFQNRTALEELILKGDGLVSIGDIPFSNCTSLKSIGPAPIDVTGTKDVFSQCEQLESISIGGNVEDTAFVNTRIATIDMTQVQSVGRESFTGAQNLTAANLESCVSIGERAFASCYQLSEVSIGSSILTIDTQAFSGCNGLQTVSIEATVPPTIGSGIFDGTAAQWGGLTIYVPAASLEAYQQAWSEYSACIVGR